MSGPWSEPVPAWSLRLRAAAPFPWPALACWRARGSGMFTGHLAAVTLERGPLSLPGHGVAWQRRGRGSSPVTGLRWQSPRRPLGVGTTKVSASVHARRDAFPELPQGYAAGDIGHRQPEFYQRYGGRLSGLGGRGCGLPGQLAKAIHVLQRRGLRCGEDAGAGSLGRSLPWDGVSQAGGHRCVLNGSDRAWPPAVASHGGALSAGHPKIAKHRG